MIIMQLAAYGMYCCQFFCGKRLDRPSIRIEDTASSRLGGRCLHVRGRKTKRVWVEESPGSKEIRWRLTAAGGDPRDSATEINRRAGALGQRGGKGEKVR